MDQTTEETLKREDEFWAQVMRDIEWLLEISEKTEGEGK